MIHNQAGWNENDRAAEQRTRGGQHRVESHELSPEDCRACIADRGRNDGQLGGELLPNPRQSLYADDQANADRSGNDAK